MLLLIIYIAIAIGVSFLCSIAEAVILSVSTAYISVLEGEGRQSGQLLQAHTQDINRPLSAILTLNTFAHTFGAAGAGAQAAIIFGDAYLGLASAILTLMILIFSEIIPKTLGATYWRQLAPATAYLLKYLILMMYPFVKMSQWLTQHIASENPLRGLNRDELVAMAQLSKQEGQLAIQEANILENLLALHQMKIRDAMTHRTVVFSLPENMQVETFFHKHDDVSFSRIPVYEEEPEKVSGFVLKTDLLLAQARGNGHRQLKEYRKDMVTMLSSMPLAQTFDYFLNNRAHMLLVVDEYGGLEGILTLEDLLEALIGMEIVDEKDKTISMKKLAHLMAKRRETDMIIKKND
ncbi:CNNM domain-containing protein [Aliiglaciecola sp. CAU 1673]|uniref:CNNM domain-containing protein n=1 Tax=Aliiglaciecola sp. CAU 1673 TaxID=3032595 RepID=UPI0023DB5906|nr:CNNM domain-containing protein [Aliiglaciecola sp. CAU 1673]MDF2177705.1 CNNM domain-containing protein [Aliiglaciecola sp. CAU 1673]